MSGCPHSFGSPKLKQIPLHHAQILNKPATPRVASEDIEIGIYPNCISGPVLKDCPSKPHHGSSKTITPPKANKGSGPIGPQVLPARASAFSIDGQIGISKACSCRLCAGGHASNPFRLKQSKNMKLSNPAQTAESPPLNFQPTGPDDYRSRVSSCQADDGKPVMNSILRRHIPEKGSIELVRDSHWLRVSRKRNLTLKMAQTHGSPKPPQEPASEMTDIIISWRKFFMRGKGKVRSGSDIGTTEEDVKDFAPHHSGQATSSAAAEVSENSSNSNDQDAQVDKISAKGRWKKAKVKLTAVRVIQKMENAVVMKADSIIFQIDEWLSRLDSYFSRIDAFLQEAEAFEGQVEMLQEYLRLKNYGNFRETD